MFILENPYVSTLLLDTLEKNQFEVLENSISNKFKEKYNLNIIDKKNTASLCQQNEKLKIYSNSENSINWVLKNYPNSNLSKLINICKNKYEFRKKLESLYPNFFFKEILLEDLDRIDISEFPEQFIIKPSIGFLSMGVHKVSSHSQWKTIVEAIQNEVKTFKEHFPEEVLNSSSFIVEEIIHGDEYAVDAYYDEKGTPVILNIFQHPFVSEDDVSDRAYISSKEIIENNLKEFEELLLKIGNNLNAKNYPIHIEIIKNQKEIIPVEINPMRFAGWCTTDLAFFAYGINIYEYFVNNLKPDWNEILKGKENKTYYFAMAETPNDIDKQNITFDYAALKQNFSNILEFRQIDYLHKPLFAILFGETQRKAEITEILQLDMHSFIKKSVS